jgi:hypothetical protein
VLRTSEIFSIVIADAVGGFLDFIAVALAILLAIVNHAEESLLALRNTFFCE